MLTMRPGVGPPLSSGRNCCVTDTTPAAHRGLALLGVSSESWKVPASLCPGACRSKSTQAAVSAAAGSGRVWGNQSGIQFRSSS